MTIKVTDEDVRAAAIACSNADELMKMFPVTDLGMRAALESFVARHPELALQRAMHEPASDDDAAAAFNAMRNFHALDTDGWKNVVNTILARRAAAVREPVVVTEDAFIECRRAYLKVRAMPSSAEGKAMDFALEWLADHLNGKHEKPVDPRVEKLAAILRDAGMDADKAQAAAARATAELVAELDEAKP